MIKKYTHVFIDIFKNIFQYLLLKNVEKNILSRY